MKQVNLLVRGTNCCCRTATRTGKSSLGFSALLKLTLLVLLVQVAWMRPAFSQTTGDAGIYANFGIDGDLYTGEFQFPAIPCTFPSGAAILASDDWFPGPNGTGF